MHKTNKFPPEMRERAVRPVQGQRGEYALLWAAVESIASKTACMAHTLLERVKRAEIEAGACLGLSTAEAQRIKDAGTRCQRTALC
jgi:hypothetical protein